MSRKLLVLAVALMLLTLAGLVFATEMVKTKAMPNNPVYITGDEPVASAQYYPSTPGLICQSPGEIMGYSQYDFQTNGSTGRRVVVDAQGGLHFDWTCGDPYPSIRNIKYNCFTPTSPSQWPEEGTTISYRNGAGYATIDVTSDGRAACAFHQAPTNAESMFVAIDQFQCLGAMDMRHPGNRIGSFKLLWPYITVDRSNRIHLVATTNTNSQTYTYKPMGYTRSNDGGTTWVAITTFDTSRTISSIVVSSKVSDKVAIVYAHPTDTTGGRNNVYYIQSEDGITWNNFSPKVNITNYHRNNDSLYAYTEVSALYDYNDNLHIVWNGIYVQGAPNTTPYFYYGRSHLYHWDATSNAINYFADFDSTWPSTGCEMGGWNFTLCKFSVVTDPSNNLFVTYTSWDTSDCSLAGYANGDIYMQRSNDNGRTWLPRINMTNSQTPQCAAGDCDSDNWSSAAEHVTDGTLHLFYVNDKDAGGIPMTEGAATDNPMLYLAFPVNAVGEDIQQPKDFSLSQNYPNPFNARTNIEFELTKPANVNLVVYDIVGARVATLLNDNMESGKHQINWDASRIASGVYYYTLRANGSEVTKKMTLLK
jgi:hypothetical protein